LLKVWEASNCRRKVATLSDHSEWVYRSVFSPDVAVLVFGSMDNTLKVWDALNWRRKIATLSGHSDWVFSGLFSLDGAVSVSGSWDKTLKVLY